VLFFLSFTQDGDSVQLLALGPLDNEATKQLVAACFDSSSDKISDSLYQSISDRAGGVPMYVRSFSSWLKEKQLIVRAEDGSVNLNSDVGDKLKFPETLVATVLERLDGLDEVSMRVIKLCSCFGFEFRLAELRLTAMDFLDGKKNNTNELLDNSLLVLADRGMVVHVQEARADVHLKFTHQILCTYIVLVVVFVE